MIKRRIKYYLKHWKVGVHLMFRTKRFGVNNQWWNNYDSMWGYSNIRKLFHILNIKQFIKNYKHMKLRAGTMCHFLTDEDYKDCFGEDKGENK